MRLDVPPDNSVFSRFDLECKAELLPNQARYQIRGKVR